MPTAAAAAIGPPTSTHTHAYAPTPSSSSSYYWLTQLKQQYLEGKQALRCLNQDFLAYTGTPSGKVGSWDAEKEKCWEGEA